MITVFLAFLALAVAFGGWISVRRTEFIDGSSADITRYLVTLPVSEWKDGGDE